MRPIGKSVPPGRKSSSWAASATGGDIAMVPQYDYRQRLEHETPDDAECISLAQDVHIAAREDDRRDLQARDQVHDAIVGAEALVRMAKPVEQDAIFGDPA